MLIRRTVANGSCPIGYEFDGIKNGPTHYKEIKNGVIHAAEFCEIVEPTPHFEFGESYGRLITFDAISKRIKRNLRFY